MSYDVIPTDVFARHLKQIAKTYPGIKSDIKSLQGQLQKNPNIGDPLGKDCYKVRISITGKPAGKSYGARVIICVKVKNRKVYLLAMYDKSDKKDLESGELDRLIKKGGL